eukprot:1103738-Ditylum_brightwellii.AAC.1
MDLEMLQVGGFEAASPTNWASDIGLEFGELTNLVDMLEDKELGGRLEGVEVLIFTDNTTTEGAFYKCTLSSRHLYDQILHLNKMQLQHKCKVHIIHVAGTQMIAQGTNALSQGNLDEGVMKGQCMVSSVPINKSALSICDNLKPWIETWVPMDTVFLTPED